MESKSDSIWASISPCTISSIAGTQPPQTVPAPQERATWPRLEAPSRTARRTWRSEMPLQWQTTMASILEGVKSKINVNFSTQ